MGWIDYSKRDRSKKLPGLLSLAYDQVYPKFDKLIQDTKPDVVICDYFSVACIDYCQKYKIPLIIGFQPLDASIDPLPYINDNIEYYLPATIETMSFFERWYAKYILQYFGIGFRSEIRDQLNEVRAKHGIPKKLKQWGDIDLEYKLFSSFIGWEIPRVFHPNIEMVGPIRSPSTVPLTQDLEEFLNEHDKVMFIAFGSAAILTLNDLKLIVESSLLAIKKGVIDGVVFATLTPIEDFPKEFTIDSQIINIEELANGKVNGLKLMKFAPQQAILEHQNTKLFLSHGGLESVTESIFSLTPILAMPWNLHSDQRNNAQLVKYNGLGGAVNRFKDTPITIVNEIERVLIDKDGSITRDLKRLKTIAHYKSKQISQTADKIVSFAKVAKFCRTPNDLKEEIPCELKHLVTVDQKISYFRAYNYDVTIFHYFLIALLMSFIIYLLLKGLKLIKSNGCVAPNYRANKTEKNE
ncbi:glycosyltransferase family 1 protein [Conidiobolus coronatus NRRL 28638]|uniref:Glycosyltransferase family 1 protein n=1 Tax=Conidiobolus coronatus (strain ATCC 28846 / CBS 209.66 / NRRL 28638) TaxID=796925 RepID=A0A137PCG6_CONC2|nr:glycosyltransferase family 1 protein [Conidiobolus coronatus NRRL 28638]|eukprot:KXN72686.1 glycosyltransferase family 1 protein [Conidiobolus coronatus NRRL 28638]